MTVLPEDTKEVHSLRFIFVFSDGADNVEEPNLLCEGQKCDSIAWRKVKNTII